MKKILLFAVMVCMVTNAAMAQKPAENVNNANVIDYSFNVNNRSVSRYLGLNQEQAEQMEYVFDRLNDDLRRVKNSRDEYRESRFMKAMSYHLSAAHQVMNKDQYRLYLSVFNSTLKSKGLVTLYYSNDLALNK